MQTLFAIRTAKFYNVLWRDIADDENEISIVQ